MIWLALALLILCSGTISASETALFSLPRFDSPRSGQDAPRRLQRVRRLMMDPHRVLMTVLITNTAVNVAIFSISYMSLRRFQDGHAGLVALGGVATLLAVILVGEIIPKGIALGHARLLAAPAGALIATLQATLAPVLWLLSAFLVTPAIRLLAPSAGRSGPVTPEELRQLVEHSAREGEINSKENNMLQVVIGMGDIRVREVMTPRVDLEAAKLSADRNAVIGAMLRTGQDELLVFDRNLDHICGRVVLRDIHIHPHKSIRELMHEVHFVPEQINLMQLLRGFQVVGAQSAVVVDEYGGTAGAVSIEDIVERIVGDLPTEEELQTALVAERIDDDNYRLPGALSVRVWADQFGIDGVDRRVDTIAGLVLSKLGRMPHVGDAVRISNLILTVDRLRNRRIEWVRLRRIDPNAPQPEPVR